MAAKRKNILDVYRDFKKRDPEMTYAFGDAQFFTFYMADAHRIHNALPDVRIEHERYDFIRVHNLAFLQLAARLKSVGVRLAMVARRLEKAGTYSYAISGHFDDGD